MFQLNNGTINLDKNQVDRIFDPAEVSGWNYALYSAGFLAGNSYNVKIVVYGLEKVNVNATLTPWTEGEDIYLDPIDGAASLAAQGE